MSSETTPSLTSPIEVPKGNRLALLSAFLGGAAVSAAAIFGYQVKHPDEFDKSSFTVLSGVPFPDAPDAPGRQIELRFISSEPIESDKIADEAERRIVGAPHSVSGLLLPEGAKAAQPDCVVQNGLLPDQGVEAITATDMSCTYMILREGGEPPATN